MTAIVWLWVALSVLWLHWREIAMRINHNEQDECTTMLGSIWIVTSCSGGAKRGVMVMLTEKRPEGRMVVSMIGGSVKGSGRKRKRRLSSYSSCNVCQRSLSCNGTRQEQHTIHFRTFHQEDQSNRRRKSLLDQQRVMVNRHAKGILISLTLSL